MPRSSDHIILCSKTHSKSAGLDVGANALKILDPRIDAVDAAMHEVDKVCEGVWCD